MENQEKKEQNIKNALELSNKSLEFDPTKDYSMSNPFSKFSIAGGIIGGGGLAITGGALGACALFNSVSLVSVSFFGTTTILPAGYAYFGGLAVTGIGLAISIPALLGLGAFEIYKKIKAEKMKDFINEVFDENNVKRKEEREIYIKTYEVIEKYFLSEIEIKSNADIDSRLDEMNKLEINLIEKKNFEKLNNLINSEISNKFKLNVLVLGKTGVGKSQLINRILEFDKAPVGDTPDPCLIKFWPKKYPEKENDSSIKWIKLFDTEGIECGKVNGNDLENHFKKVENYFKKNAIDLDKQINMIWYCVHGNKLETGEKDYIKDIIDVYKTKMQSSHFIYIYKSI